MIAKLYLEDKNHFLQLPGKAFECVRYEQLRANKYRFVRVDTMQYSTSPRFAGELVTARISFDTVTILNEKNELIVQHPRLYGEETKSMDWQPYLTLMARRPTALKYSTFYDQLPDEWKDFFENCTSEEKRNGLQLLAVLLKDQDFHVSVEALKLASQHSHPSVETIKHVYYQLLNGRGIRETISLSINVPATSPPTRGLAHYDQLMKPNSEENDK
ncbi:hypothetical protein [Terribacillus sp. DMT04]|uniref:Mu transposase domain-containing protein n=1 Tax=Terribacillus sp. DMT04 TaxID=2850441 RepID=UPI001C2BD5E0|nr:hypothetical protein [Terribacillus sp. DMT04]QXE02507.1 hypothetical protein KS242_04625 [Terribacillus sp. DMT04]